MIETLTWIGICWVAMAFSAIAGYVLGAKMHGTNAYDEGFANGREYQKLVERGVYEE